MTDFMRVLYHNHRYFKYQEKKRILLQKTLYLLRKQCALDVLVRMPQLMIFVNSF